MMKSVSTSFLTLLLTAHACEINIGYFLDQTAEKQAITEWDYDDYSYVTVDYGLRDSYLVEYSIGLQKHVFTNLALRDINDNASLLPNCTLVYVDKDLESQPVAWVGPEDIDKAEFMSIYFSINSMLATSLVPLVSPFSKNAEMVRKKSESLDYAYFVRAVPNDANHIKALLSLSFAMDWYNIFIVMADEFFGIYRSVISNSVRSLGNFYEWTDRVTLDDINGANAGWVYTNIKDHGYMINMLYFPTEWYASFQEQVKARGLNTLDRVWMSIRLDPGAYLALPNVIYADPAPLSSHESATAQAHVARWDSMNRVWNSSTDGWHSDDNLLFYQEVYSSPFFYLWDVSDAKAGDGLVDPRAVYTYDTVFLVAHALDAVIKAGGDVQNGTLLREELLNVDFTGVTGRVKLDQETQDRLQNTAMFLQPTNASTPIVFIAQSVVLDSPGANDTTISCPPEEAPLTVCVTLSDAVRNQTQIFADGTTRIPMDGRQMTAHSSWRDSLGYQHWKSGREVHLDFNAMDNWNWAAPCIYECQHVDAGLFGDLDDDDLDIPDPCADDANTSTNTTNSNNTTSTNTTGVTGNVTTDTPNNTLSVNVTDDNTNITNTTSTNATAVESSSSNATNITTINSTESENGSSTNATIDSNDTVEANGSSTNASTNASSESESARLLTSAEEEVASTIDESTAEEEVTSTVDDSAPEEEVASTVDESTSCVSPPDWLRSSECITCLSKFGKFQPNFIEHWAVRLYRLPYPEGDMNDNIELDIQLDDGTYNGSSMELQLFPPDEQHREYSKFSFKLILPEVNRSSRFFIDTTYNGQRVKITEAGSEIILVHPQACAPGDFVFDGVKCLPCLPGLFSFKTDSDRCLPCPPGYFSANLQSRGCEACPAGTRSSSGGSVECEVCPAGKHSSNNASTMCDHCPLGTYSLSPKSNICTSCNVNDTRQCQWIDDRQFKAVQSDESDSCIFQTTRIAGADSPSYCVCPVGTYRSKTDPNVCVRCSTGMRCLEEDMSEPEQLDGYWLERLPDDPDAYLAWLCMFTEYCPAGAFGVCGEFREAGIQSCSRCQYGYYPDRGVCKKCGSVDILPATFMLLLFVGPLLFLFHIASSVPINKMHRSSVSLMLQITLLVSTVLSMNVFSSVDVDWVSPLFEFWEFFKIFLFDFDLFKFQCMASTTDPIALYLIKIFLLPTAVVVLFLQGVAFNACPGCLSRLRTKIGHSPFNHAAILNTIGAMFSVFMITISVIALEPLQCAQHPSGFSTMTTDYSMTCWQGGDHTTLVFLSIFALLCFPIAVLVIVLYVTLHFDRFLGRGHVWFMRSTGFIFKRFRPEAYYFGFLFVLRNFVLSLIPVVFANTLAGSILALALVLLAWVFGVSRRMPWRVRWINYVDSFITSFMLLVLLCIALLPNQRRFLSQSSDENASVVGWVAVGISTICLALFVLMIVYVIVSSFNPSKKYTFFLSHHKQAAAVFARQLKMMMEEAKPNWKAFLDVDELSRLDTLAFTVRSETKHLVLLITSETFTRLWCALEVSVAWKNDISIIPVVCYVGEDVGHGKAFNIALDINEQNLHYTTSGK